MNKHYKESHVIILLIMVGIALILGTMLTLSYISRQITREGRTASQESSRKLDKILCITSIPASIRTQEDINRCLAK